MNLVPGHVAGGASGPSFVSGALRVPVPQYARLQGWVQARRLILGLRPEDISVASDDIDALSAKVYAVEHLGREAILVVESEAGRLRAVVPPDFLGRVDDVVRLRLNGSRSRLFDAETGQALDAAPGREDRYADRVLPSRGGR